MQKDFKHGYRELLLLLTLPEHLSSAARRPFEQLEAEQAVARAVVVLLAGHVENYFNELSAEVVRLTSSSWERLGAGQRRFLATLALARMSKAVEEFAEDDFSLERRIEMLRRRLDEAEKCFRTPADVRPPVLQGFYRHRGKDPVERFLRQFRHDGQSFYGWLADRGMDPGRAKTVMEELVGIRTGIAHGRMETEVTRHDARFYVMNATLIVRVSDRFIREGIVEPGAGEPRTDAERSDAPAQAAEACA